MDKKQAYTLAKYLITEAHDILAYADVKDFKAIPHLLGTAIYISQSYNLKEKKEIQETAIHLRYKTYEQIRVITDSLDNLF